MATLVIDLDSRANVKKMIDSLYLFRSVKKVSVEEPLNYPQLDKSIAEANHGKTTRCKTVSELVQNLNA
jgi:hypothetical protein